MRYGKGAEAVAILQGGKVAQVVVTKQGTGYTKNPIVAFSTGSGATAQAIVATGQVTGFVITAPGAYGTSAKPGPAPTVTLHPPPPAGGTPAQAVARLGTLDPASFALEMIKLPERMIFRVPKPSNQP